MNKRINEYVHALAIKDFDILEEIFLKKYRKFLRFYYIISEHSNHIDMVEYNRCEDDSKLIISFNVSGKTKTLEKILDEINQEVDDSDDVVVYNDNKKITIEITKDESELP